MFLRWNMKRTMFVMFFIDVLQPLLNTHFFCSLPTLMGILAGFLLSLHYNGDYTNKRTPSLPSVILDR